MGIVPFRPMQLTAFGPIRKGPAFQKRPGLFIRGKQDLPAVHDLDRQKKSRREMSGARGGRPTTIFLQGIVDETQESHVEKRSDTTFRFHSILRSIRNTPACSIPSCIQVVILAFTG
jgi:hypothetical protein